MTGGATDVSTEFVPILANLSDGLAAAQSAADRGDQETALRIWAELRIRFPDHPVAYHRAGALLLGLGRLDEAETLLNDACRRFPNEGGIAIERAQSAERRDDHAEAAARWGEVQRLLPDHPVGYIRQGLSLREANRLEAAEAVLRVATERFPKDLGAAVWYASLADMQRRWPDALERWEQVRTRFPDNSVGYLAAAVSLREAGQLDAEDSMLAAAVEHFPGDPGAAVEFASAAVRRRDWPEMLRRWEQMKIRFPDQPTGYTGMALPLREMGRFEEAERLLLEAMERFPDESGPAIEYALVAQHQRDWPRALPRWKTVQQRFRAHPSGYTWTALVLRHLQRLDEAEEVLSVARKRFPEDPGVLTECAQLSEARNDWPAAAQCWAEVRSRTPQHAVAHSGLALALRELGRLDESEAVLAEGLQRFPSNRGLVLNHVEIARRRNDWTEVLARLTAAVEHFPSDSDIQQQLVEARSRIEEARIIAPPPPGRSIGQPRYLLFIANGVGIGHLFTAVLHSAYYAYRTGRALVLDMREVAYFGSDKHAAFFECFGFEFPPELEVITDQEEIERISKIDDRTWVSGSQPLDVARPIENTVLAVPAFTPGEPYHLGVKRADLPFRVVLRGRLREAWNRVIAMPQWSGPVIGMHFRAFVGEIGPRMNRFLVPDYDERCDALRDRFIETAHSIAEQEGYADPTFFVASDDARFATYVKERLPNAFSLASRLPDREWSSWMRAHGHDIDMLVDTVNDVWGLSECEHLIYSTRSGFSRFATLNSQKLDQRRIHPISIPLFGEILRSLEPSVAAKWARAALRKTEAMRYRETYVAEEIAHALERAGSAEETAAARRRADWHREAALPPPPVRPADSEEPTIALARARAERSPDNPYLLAGYGDSLSEVLARHGRLDEAVVAARHAIDIEPRDPYLYCQLGIVLTQLRSFDDAEAALRYAILLEPEVAQLYLYLSDCLARQDKFDAAIKTIEAAIALDPDRAHLHGRLGELLQRTGRLDEAEAALRQAIALDRSILAFPHLLSIMLERQQRYSEAASVLRHARELEPANAAWSLRLGQVLQLVGEFDEAEQAYRQAQELDPNSTGARDRLAALDAGRAAKTSSGGSDCALGSGVARE